MSVKSKISKAFKNGRKVGYWLAMKNIEKSKPKLEISKPKDISHASQKPKSKPKSPKPKLEISDVKDISIKSTKKKLSIEDQKGISKKSKPKSPKKLEIEDVKDISIKSKPKKKLTLEIEEQKPIVKKGISKDVKEFLSLDVPSKKILTIEALPPISIESKIIQKFDAGIQADKRNKIKLAVEDNINQQIIEEPFIQIREIIAEDEKNYEDDTYSYDDLYNDDDDYFYDNAGPGISVIDLINE